MCVFFAICCWCCCRRRLAFLTRACRALSVGDAIICESESEPTKKKNNRHIGSKSHVKGVMFSVFNQMKLKLDWKIVCSQKQSTKFHSEVLRLWTWFYRSPPRIFRISAPSFVFMHFDYVSLKNFEYFRKLFFFGCFPFWICCLNGSMVFGRVCSSFCCWILIAKTFKIFS